MKHEPADTNLYAYKSLIIDPYRTRTMENFYICLPAGACSFFTKILTQLFISVTLLCVYLYTYSLLIRGWVA